jgi:hypothetical protein
LNCTTASQSSGFGTCVASDNRLYRGSHASGFGDGNFQGKVVYNLVATISDDECMAEEYAEKAIGRDRVRMDDGKFFTTGSYSSLGKLVNERVQKFCQKTI